MRYQAPHEKACSRSNDLRAIEGIRNGFLFTVILAALLYLVAQVAIWGARGFPLAEPRTTEKAVHIAAPARPSSVPTNNPDGSRYVSRGGRMVDPETTRS